MAMRISTIMTMALLAMADTATGACRAESAERLLPLVELYTSEGCSSCPPADRWLSGQFASGRTTNAVALAFHVDYWDRLGWKDRFATPAYTARQYQAMRANKATFVYTPQVVVQGRDFPDWRRGSLARVLASAGAQPAKASIRLDASPTADAVEVNVVVTLATTPKASTMLALAYADGSLTSDVRAGENRGERLRHDHVVRAYATRTITARETTFEMRLQRPAEAGAHPTLVAFVQDAGSGEVLQTVALPIASCPS